MKTLIYITVAAAFALLVLSSGCGSRRGARGSLTGATVPDGRSVQSKAEPSQSDVFTQEDRQLMATSYEDRLQYLQQKYRELVLEMHGVVIEDGADSAKGASSTLDEEHKVEADDPRPNHEWQFNETIHEDLFLERQGDEWRWNLTFFERVYGDYDFDGTVSIADLTPIAMYYGNKWHADWEPPQWDDPTDPHIDRISDHNGVIGITDITPIAMNFGKQIAGYNVYYLPEGQSDWQQPYNPIAEWRRESTSMKPDTGNCVDTDYRDFWQCDDDEDKLEFSPRYIKNETGRMVSSGDRLTVIPVFLVSDEEEVGTEEMRSEEVTFENVPENQLPVAVISVDPLVVAVENPTLLDGSASDDPDEGDEVTAYKFFVYRVTHDGRTLVYTYEEEEGSDPPDGEYDGKTNCTFAAPGEYVAELSVRSEGEYLGEPWTAWSLWASSPTITVIGPPSIESFTASPHPELEEDPLEVPVEVNFEVIAQDTDGIGIDEVWFSFYGDENWTVASTLEPYDDEYRYIATATHEFTADDLDGNHSRHLFSRVKVVDSGGTSYMNLEPPLEIAHAVPHAALTIQPASGCIFVSESVTFDASGSYDKDGENQKPTKYVFDFGDGTVEEYSDPIVETVEHPYGSSGLYTASVTVYDDMYDEQGPPCDQRLLHKDSATVEIRVYGDPQLQPPYTIDSSTVSDGTGIYEDVEWVSLGVPCIAVTINPVSRLPAIVYTGDPPVPAPSEWPLKVALYTEMTEQGLWCIPELVWSGTEAHDEDEEEISGTLGTQCDIEFDPTIKDEEAQLPYVAVSYNYKNIQSGTPSSQGIYLFRRIGSKWYRGEEEDELYSGFINEESPIRLVANSVGQFVHFRGEDLANRESLCEIWPEDDDGIPTIVEVAEDVDMPHDQKPYLDELGQRRTATVYIWDISDPIVKYEVMTENFNWIPPGDPVGQSGFSAAMTRCLSLDYFGNVEFAILWVDDNQDLVFHCRKGVETLEEVLNSDSDCGNWCDFDYEKNLGIACVAYDKEFWIEDKKYYHIYFTARMRIPQSEEYYWTLPIEVDTLSYGEESHLDLDVANGYVYMAYTKDGVINCAVLDFFNDNR
ncbi:PKD domain-containing protein [bacterium]|nr:PKD domain-containing protein [bacterium]